MEAHAFNPRGQEAAADKSLWIQGQTGLPNKFQDNQSYRERPRLQQHYHQQAYLF